MAVPNWARYAGAHRHKTWWTDREPPLWAAAAIEGRLEVAHELVNALLVLGLAQRRQMGVDDRGGGVAMSQVNLELAQIFALFQQMRRVGMTQGVDMRLLGEPTSLEGRKAP